MRTYTATLPTGETLTRNSEREYAAAWAIIDRETNTVRMSGFAGTEKLAKSSGGSEYRYLSGAHERTSRNIHVRRRYKANRAAWDKRISEFEARHELVVVAVKGGA